MSICKVISDLSIAEPKSAISSNAKQGCWRTTNYQCGEIVGKMVYTDSSLMHPSHNGYSLKPSSLTVPILRLKLNVTGWHRVIVGIWGDVEGRKYGASGQRMKLSGDRSYVPLVRQTPVEGSTLALETIEEVVFTHADLTNQDLMIAPPFPNSDTVTAVAYVKLESLSEAEIREIKKDRNSSSTRKLISYNDGLSFFGRKEYWEKEDIWEMIEPYRYSDVKTLVWGLVGDRTIFPTKAGEMVEGPGSEKFYSLKDRGINPLVTALEYAHEMGLEFYVYQRMGAWLDTFPHEIWSSKFTLNHPEFRCVSKDGKLLTRMSYAYPEVRQRQIDLLAEVAAYGVDGIDLKFMRGPVFTFYEDVLVEGFKKEFGEDPRVLDEWDERWLKYRRWPMTKFVKDLRVKLDEVGKNLGKRIAISAITFPTALGNLYYGLDIETWVKEGLVDRLVPWGNVRGMPPADLDYYIKLTKGTSTTIWPHLFVFIDKTYMAKPGHDYKQDALDHYDKGAEGLAMWDLVGFDALNKTGPSLRRLGHIDEMREDVKNGGMYEPPIYQKLQQLGDADMSVFSAPTENRDRLIPNYYPKHMVMWPS